MAPLPDFIRLLKPRAILWMLLTASGRWGLSFRQREDTLFCWVQNGQCLLLRPNVEPILLGEGDCVLIRMSTQFTFASDTKAKPVESERLFASAGSTSMRLGKGKKSPVVLRGGRFVLDTTNESLFAELLPQIVHVHSDDATSRHLHALLSINVEESRSPGPWSAFVIERLMDLILAEILRRRFLELDPLQTGLIAGLADPVITTALSAMHSDIARKWTLASLARHCGVSRTGLSQRFRVVMGIGPIEYLQRWRIAIAKDEIRTGARTVSEIAFAVGFQSASAFSTAFTREIGCSPSQFSRLEIQAVTPTTL